MLFVLSLQQPLLVKESWQVSELSLSSLCLFFFLYWNVPKKEENHWQAKSCFNLVSNKPAQYAVTGPFTTPSVEDATPT